VRSRAWHLVLRQQGRLEAWQLFDVKADPGERPDVADKHPAVVKELDRRLRQVVGRGASQGW